MAYLSNATLCQTIALSGLRTNSSNWALTFNNHSWSLDKAAGAETCVLLAGLDLPHSSRSMEGARLLKVEICYQINTSAATVFTPALYRQTFGSTATAQAIAIRYDTAHDTNAKRVSTGLHRLQLCTSEEKFVTSDEICLLELSVQTNGSSVIQILGLQMHYALRL
jgi:hypothetical protein